MNVLLIDDHPLMLAALQSVVEGLQEGHRVFAAQNSAQALVCMQPPYHIDLVLLDLMLGEEDGFQLLQRILKLRPEMPVLVVSGNEESADIRKAMELGARGFVPKRNTGEVLAQAIRRVGGGGITFPDPDDERLAEFRQKNGVSPAGLRGVAGQPHPLATLGLTQRQCDVLALVAEGLTNKEIARELGLSIETVKDHVAAILKALQVTSRTQAVLAMSQRGLL